MCIPIPYSELKSHDIDQMFLVYLFDVMISEPSSSTQF